MRDRSARWLASGVWLLGLALAVTGAVLQFITRDVGVEYYGVRGFQAPFGLVISGVGWLIATRRRGNPIGWIFLGAGFVSCLQGFDSGYATYSVAEHGGTLPLTDFFVWLAVWVWVLIIAPLSTVVLLLFPEGRLETRRQRGIAVFSVVAMIAFGVAMALTPGQAGETPAGVDNPYALSEAQAEPLTATGGMLFIASVLASIAVLIARFRRSTGELRQQMKWLMYASTLAGIATITSVAYLGTGGDDIQAGLTRVSAIGVIVGFVGIPIAVGIAVLRYGLYEIDVVINRTIVYTMLAAFITVVYLAVVVGIGALVGAGDEPNTGLTIAATAIVAIAFQPVRNRAHHLANRLVFGKRSTPYEALSEFSARLSGGVATDDALPRLARLMTEATAADRASVWLVVGAELHPAGSSDIDVLEPVHLSGETIEIPGADRVYPVRHEGELLGALALSTPPSEPLNPSQARLIEDLASQAGLLLRNARLIADLRASRQRLVAAQDLERQRIERNIHDGAQQQLVALAVNLRLARQLLDRDPTQAGEMIENIQGDASEALEDLRALAHGIYPPVLAERGLVAALQSQAAKAPLPVTVEADGIARYQQEIEAAVYFCALEALQNIGKYAGASHATVRIAAGERSLSFTVTDDGGGFDPRTVQRGAGLTNMADRLDAIGGRLEVRSEPGEGTSIGGRLPAQPVD